MRSLALSLLLVCVACAGCAPVARVEMPAPTTVPDAFVAAPEEVAPDTDAPWWTTFGDPRLDTLVEKALANNHDLEAAAARVARAEALARIAGADALPSVGLATSFNRQRQNFIGLPIPGGPLSTTSTRLGVSLETSWEADLWGRLRAGERAAVADAAAAVEEYRGARLSLAGQTARAWFALLAADEQLALARATEASFAESAERVRSRFEAGLRPAVELRLALSSLETAREGVARRRLERERALRQLEILVGDYPAGALEPGARGLREPPDAVPVGLPSTLVARRPDLAAAERRVLGAGQRTLAARRALYPRLTLTAGAGTASEQLEDLLDGDFRVWNLVAGLTQPLFQGGRLRADVEAKQQTEREAVASFRAAALRAYAEVETALVAESALAERLVHLEAASEQLRAAVTLADDRYRNGIGDYLTVLESRTRALQADTAAIDARRARLDNRIGLHLALGGDFRPEQDR